MKKTYFISAIDTDAGKTYATGWLAAKWMAEGKKVITQKFIQTGCTGLSEDIHAHRRLMGLPILDIDKDGTTCPIVLSYPASPHLAAKIDQKEINLDLVRASTARLLQQYDIVLLEGAGGLMVPIREDYLTIDYIAEEKLPLIFVTSARLGSINHTLLSLEACRQRNIEVNTVIFNSYPSQDKLMEDDTKQFLKNHLSRLYPAAQWLDMTKI